MSDFVKEIHAMFDHIWDCEIDHPLFQDTVGELMEAVIQAHEKHNLTLGTNLAEVGTDLISRQAAIDALHMHLMYRMGTDSNKKRLDDWINGVPSVQGKPFNLPEIYIADGYDTIEGEDGNVGFGVYVPDENQIYVAGDVEDEIRTKALLHEICHWVQAMCGRPFDEDEANRFAEVVYDALPSAQPEHTCVNCGRTANNGGWYADGGTRCPIEEHYALPKDGYCHLWEKRNVTDDDYPEGRADE